MSYQTNVSAGLDRARAIAAAVPIELRDLRLAILSDLHRGAGDDADDFRACQHTYAAAVAHYGHRRHILAILGDAEDLWECWPAEVIAEYAASIALERPFLDAGRYWRFLGNHDESWQHGILVDLYLRPLLGPVEPIKSLRLQVTDRGRPLGEIFLVHGHQGVKWEERLAWFSRRMLRYSWRPIQRLANLKTTTPATDWRLGRKHERAMYNWAVEKEGLIVIAGHTHHPAFPSPARFEQLAATYDDLRHQPEAFDAEVAERIETDLAFATRPGATVLLQHRLLLLQRREPDRHRDRRRRHPAGSLVRATGERTAGGARRRPNSRTSSAMWLQHPCRLPLDDPGPGYRASLHLRRSATLAAPERPGGWRGCLPPGPRSRPGGLR